MARPAPPLPPQGCLLLLPLFVLLFVSPPAAQAQGIFDALLAPSWSYACQAPIPLGHACEEDNDCDTGVDTGLPPQHCHLEERVCAFGLEEGEPCNEGRHCGPNLGCLATPAVMECFELLCDLDGENCTQGRSTNKLCGIEGSAPTLEAWGCATDGSEICNNSLRPLPSGVCHPPPEEEGADCIFFIDSSTACGNGMLCTMGTGACGFAVGGLGDPCPMPPNRCDMTQGLVCLSQNVEPFQSTCQRPQHLGATCNMGGECGPAAYCDVHDMRCHPIKPAGSRCQAGNECGEAPFDDHLGVDCVRQSCVDTSKEGANCWPGFPKNQCTEGRACRKRVGSGTTTPTAATVASTAAAAKRLGETRRLSGDEVGREEVEVTVEG